MKAEWGLMTRQHGVMAAVLSLTAHIPTASEHLVRDYGWYSNVSRGKRRKAQGEGPTPIGESIDISASVAGAQADQPGLACGPATGADPLPAFQRGGDPGGLLPKAAVSARLSPHTTSA